MNIESLWSAINSGNVRAVADQMFPRSAETSAPPHSSGDRQHGRKSAMRGAQERPEECSTCDDAGTAGVVDSDYDGAPYCSHCGARAAQWCDCGPIAESE